MHTMNSKSLLNLRNAIIARVQHLKPALIVQVMSSNHFQSLLDILDPDLPNYAAKDIIEAMDAFDDASAILDAIERL